MAHKEYAAGRRHAPTEIRQGLASLGIRKCPCGRQATRLHRKGSKLTVRCEFCERNAAVDAELAELKTWRSAR